tara:strand:+ start:2050 stop:2667 length:618 start_codon:yes stop_codon:yes gene_type:complete
MAQKYIITDIDGVVLDWEEGFSVWAEHHGHTKVEGYQFQYSIGDRYGLTHQQGNQMVKTFNESAAIGFLPPLRDAQFFIKKLHEQHRYKFIALTSLSLDPYAKALRERNLAKLMGNFAFDKVICLDTGADKDEALERLAKKYKGSYWIEDKPVNLEVGVNVGFKGILLEHGHNMDSNVNGFVAKNWEEIYNYIIDNEVKSTSYER